MTTTNLLCPICGNSSGNRLHTATERSLGMGNEFTYIECGHCKALSISEVPKNLADYYPAAYYSFQAVRFPTKANGIIRYLKNRLMRHYLGETSPAGWLLSRFLPHPFPWMKSGIFHFDDAILDVGCGAGRTILSMQRSGFTNLTGIDPFLAGEEKIGPEVKILRKGLDEMEGKYDLIMLHHSFEHMENPLSVLMKCSSLLNENGHILIRIPVAGSYAWHEYNTFWFALEAPRHLTLHTRESMKILADACNLTIESTGYDSSFFHLASSEKYRRGYPFSNDFSMFTSEEMKQFRQKAKELNASGDADCAIFYLRKKR